MLRNCILHVNEIELWILNEVLSLNAQEYHPVCLLGEKRNFLNEVLSLNAQEFLRYLTI